MLEFPQTCKWGLDPSICWLLLVEEQQLTPGNHHIQSPGKRCNILPNEFPEPGIGCWPMCRDWSSPQNCLHYLDPASIITLLEEEQLLCSQEQDNGLPMLIYPWHVTVIDFRAPKAKHPFQNQCPLAPTQRCWEPIYIQNAMNFCIIWKWLQIALASCIQHLPSSKRSCRSWLPRFSKVVFF